MCRKKLFFTCLFPPRLCSQTQLPKAPCPPKLFPGSPPKSELRGGGLQVIRRTLLIIIIIAQQEWFALLGGVFSFAETCYIWRYFAFYRVPRLRVPPPQKETSTQTNRNRIRNGLPLPCCSHSPQPCPLGGIGGPCAPTSNDTPSESHTRAGPGCPRKGSTARGFGLAEPPQVGPLTSIPPPHFSVDDLIELCLFVPGTTEHVLEAINYRNVAISKRTLGTG